MNNILIVQDINYGFGDCAVVLVLVHIGVFVYHFNFDVCVTFVLLYLPDLYIVVITCHVI